MDWQKVEGNIKPLEIEISEKLVYIRKDFAEVTKENDGNEYTLWEYDEVRLAKSDVGNIVKYLGEIYDNKIAEQSETIDEIIISMLEV